MSSPIATAQPAGRNVPGSGSCAPTVGSFPRNPLAVAFWFAESATDEMLIVGSPTMVPVRSTVTPAPPS